MQGATGDPGRGTISHMQLKITITTAKTQSSQINTNKLKKKYPQLVR